MAQVSTGTADWRVNLAALEQAKNDVAREATNIDDVSGRLSDVFNSIMLNWRGGSGNSFRAEVPNFYRAADDLKRLLDEAVRRMTLAHANYVDAEQKNVATLTPNG